jgi:hypothetical protein
MIAHRSRYADASWWTFSLEASNYIHRVAVQVGPIGDSVANVDTDAKANGTIWRLVAVQYWNPLLYLHRAPHGSINAVEHKEQRISTGLNDLAAMFFDGWVYQVLS